MKRQGVLVFFLLVFLVACAPNSEQVIPEGATGNVVIAEFVGCTSPRPEMCTEQYDPVCARVDTGIRCSSASCPSVEWMTMGNACSACNDQEVYGYTEGACDVPMEAQSLDPVDYASWPTCERPNDCGFACAYVLRDWNSDLLEWPGALDDNDLPAMARRCITPEYAESMLGYGLAVVKRDGTTSFATR